MSAATESKAILPPMDLSKWRAVPALLMLIGGCAALAGVFVNRQQFAFSWLLAFMFYLSLALGSLMLVILHHLFDASWSVGLRRVMEHLACLSGALAALFIPIALLAPTTMYPWMQQLLRHRYDHALLSKMPLFTLPGFYLSSFGCLAIWVILARGLRKWSLRQDETGEALCTYRMRRYSYFGVFMFAITVTLAAILWMKSLQDEWYSTMYGVIYFAGAVWTTLATVYVIAALLQRQGPLREVVGEEQFYFLGSLLFAFTVFYAYVHFAEYFIIWNANMPEETFWYHVRERGSWWDIGMIIIFGHFFVPFLTLLRIDVKLKLSIMFPLAIWAWLMQFCDLSYNIMPPVAHPNGFVLHWMDIACMAFMGGLLASVFLRYFNAHPPYPMKDPRLAEAMKIYLPPAAAPIEPKPSGGRAR